MKTLGLIAGLFLAQAAPEAPAAPEPPLPVAGPVLTLNEALAAARARNLDLAQAREQLERSKELHVKAWSGYLPQVSASGSYTHNSFGDVTIPAIGAPDGTPPTVITRQNQLVGQVQATQAIFAPQAMFGIAAARAGERLSAESFDAARRDILFGVAQAYYAAAGARQILAVQARQLALAEQHARDARVRQEAGTATKITVLRTEIDRSRAEQDLKRAQSSYASSRVALATLLDRKDAAFEVEIPPPPEAPAGETEVLVASALEQRPDVRAAAAAVDLAEKNRDVVIGRYFPSVSAFGRYGYSNAAGFSGDNTTWAVGLQLGWNLFDGFLRESDLRDERSRLREAESARAKVAIQAREDVVRAQLDLESARVNGQKAQEALDLAKENQRLVDWSYKAGAGTYLDVTDASTQLNLAELTLVSEELAADLAALRLLRAAGAFVPR